jgi:hypothetical protein
VPEFGTKELLNVAPPVVETMRFVLALEAVTKFPEDASRSCTNPYGFSGSDWQIGCPLGLGRVPMK